MKRLITLILVSLVFLVICFQNANGQSDKNKLENYTFDGFRIGDNYGELIKRSPYNLICDNDPIDNNARRFMCYTALPCRGNSFPKETTVMFYLKYSAENRYNQPIEAFAYLYGSYFNDKTNFPSKPGDKLNKAKRKFGKEINTFDISRKGVTLQVHHFSTDIYIISKQKKIIGFVLGKMPSDPMNEQWRALMQMYHRYTPRG